MPELDNDSFLAHLEALRMTLLACVASWAITLPFGWAAAPTVISTLTRWCCPESLSQLHYFSPLEVFMVNLRMGCLLGTMLCYPYVTYRLWRFLLPALYDDERRAWRHWLVSSSLLFVAGGAFCVVMVLPLIMKFAASFASATITPLIGLSQFISLAGKLILAFGIMFQMPIAVCIMVRFGLVSLGTIRKSRPYVLIVILFISALLTPPDVLSQIMLAAPTWVLFEFGILLASQIQAKPRDQDHPASPTDEPPSTDTPPSREAPPPPADSTHAFYESEYTR